MRQTYWKPMHVLQLEYLHSDWSLGVVGGLGGGFADRISLTALMEPLAGRPAGRPMQPLLLLLLTA